MCTLTKDIHYLCLSKPFLRDNAKGICGLQPLVSDTRCPAEAKPHTQVTETQAEIVGDRWLVNTPVRTATLTYDQHDTATRVNLLDQIPKGATQHIDITPVDTALQALSRQPILNPSSAVRAWTAADTARCTSTVIGHTLTLGVTFILYRRLNEMQTSTAKLTTIMNRPKRKIMKPSKYRMVGENATSTEVACGSSTTTLSGKHDDAFKYKIITLKAEITLLKDECDFLKKEIKKMKSAVPSATAQRYTVVPQPSVLRDQWDSNSSTSESPVEVLKKKSKKRKKKKSKRSK
ncbi:uncharacterized protein LOC132134219 [Carassius carassius]|uniref:uncharacterized protein LOC132134219 n=1 Tax=Carassius carassius TaxID=217509 RepID=UPI002868B911|nr:uncharacterized protein LOC132134219 [Carassius carassius]